MKKVFKFKVDCANCAAKIENEINKIDGVIIAKISFMAEKLVFEAEDGKFDKALLEAVKVSKKIEPDSEIIGVKVAK